MSTYDDIIGLPHPEPSTRRRMSAMNRAAQFAPFSALQGHSEMLAETSRITDRMPDLSDEERNEISRIITQAIRQPRCEITIVYFIPDSRKEGGSFVRHTGVVKCIDEYASSLIFTDSTSIPIKYITTVILHSRHS